MYLVVICCVIISNYIDNEQIIYRAAVARNDAYRVEGLSERKQMDFKLGNFFSGEFGIKYTFK